MKVKETIKSTREFISLLFLIGAVMLLTLLFGDPTPPVFADPTPQEEDC